MKILQHFAIRNLMLVIFLSGLCPTQIFAADKAIGTITRIQTAALINTKTAKTTAAVFTGDVITTDANGRLEITFNDSTTLVVGGSSEFLIDTYSFNNDSTVKEALFKLSRGAFRAITSTLVDSAPNKFLVTTPLATIGIRGTDFWGGYLTADTLDVIMLKGKGVVVATSGGTVVIEKPGFGVSVPDPSLPPQNYRQWDKGKVARATATINFQ